ncbi:hypothetical protein BCV69DRAFT_312642 [Microstroma glucosiphilum]|uniref:TPPC8 first Ig-like domain-containing protein n=1 Tax=Pseudomicrostroma glucosiphilum TaxID=1684307 RepID=A0A316U894_9BASI|nr:hypothetical protein BCV69DRAFT_312642 [Pseudomicrostroma glucosiphilum]PWN20691.1 hypothetical protein BCV69DRAFT_312642 [Pseudomicrostroma glucosiphilum]
MDGLPSSSKFPLSSPRRKENASQAFDIVHRALSPRIAVLSSPDVDEILRPNNFGDLSDCLRPFEEILQGVIVRTSQLESKQCPSFPIRFDPLSAFAVQQRASIDPENATAGRDVRPEETLDRINAHVTANARKWEAKTSELQIEDEGDARRVAESSIEDITPWYTYGRDAVLRSRSISRHETFGHPVCILLAVSSQSPDPLNALASLYAATQAQNCDAFGGRPYMDPNVLRYYVLIHDCAKGADVEQSKEILETVKRIYGLNCCILPLNSAPQPQADGEPPTSTAWSEHLQRLRGSGSGSEKYLDSWPSGQQGLLLSEDDVKRLGGLVREMVAQSLIPWMERCVTQWNDSIAASRKGLTGRLFGAGKKFFGSSTMSRSGTGTPERPSWDAHGSFYPYAAIEAQTRRLADFAFMTRDYKLAAAMYDVGRRDYANDKAHHHAAGATEMFGLSHLMIMLSSQSPPIDVDSYLASACMQYRLPVSKASSNVLLRPLRATLLYYEVYRALDYYRSAPSALIRAAQDPGADLDVMGAMLIEQAAITDLRIFDRPALRKMALHLVMAGHRYQECGAKLLSLRCFSGAKSIYSRHTALKKTFLDGEESGDKDSGEKESSDEQAHDTDMESEGWTMVQAHVEHELGQQALNEGQTDLAIEHFLRTIRPVRSDCGEDAASLENRGVIHQGYLSDLAAAFSSLGEGAGKGDALDSPFDFFDVQKSRFELADEAAEVSEESLWKDLEERFNLASGRSMVTEGGSGKGSRARGSFTAGVPFRLLLRVVNPLSTPLTLSQVTVQVTRDSEPQTSVTGTDMEVDSIQDIELAPQEQRDLHVTCKASSLGQFRATSIIFRLGGIALFSQSLHKNGRRLNETKEQRVSRKATYAPDETLAVVIGEPCPILEAHLVNCPTALGFGEEVDVVLRLTNRGNVSTKRGVRMMADQPEMCTLAAASEQPGPLVTVPNSLTPPQLITILRSDEDLEAGQTVDKTMRLRGALIGKNIVLRLLFVAGSGAEDQVSHKLSQTIEVYPVLDLSVEISSAPQGFAWDLAIQAANVHPDGQPVRIADLKFASPRWETQETNRTLSSAAGEPLLVLQPSQSDRAHVPVREAALEDGQLDPSAMLEYTSHHIAGLLRGRDIERNAVAGPCSLRLSSTVGSPSSSAMSPFLPIVRSTWRQTLLSQVFPTISPADRDRVFTLYIPDDLDVLVNWESHDGQHKGQIFLLGLTLGPNRDVVRDIVSSLAAGAGGRSLYEETARERAALLSSLSRSYLGTEDDPLYVDIEVRETDAATLETVPVVFVVRNMSTSRSARCIIDLDSSVDPSASRSGHAQRQQDPQHPDRLLHLNTASWIGRLTLRSQTIPPRGSVELIAHARRPKVGQECELSDWSIKSEVLGDKGLEEVLKRFNSGRLKSGKVV